MITRLPAPANRYLMAGVQAFGQPKLSVNLFLLDPDTDITELDLDHPSSDQPGSPSSAEADHDEVGVTGRAVLTDSAADRLRRAFPLAASTSRVGHIGLIDGACGDAFVTEDGGAGSPMSLGLELYLNPPAPAPVTLMVALCRKKVLGRVLETATAIGVKNFHIIDSARTDVTYWESSSHYTDQASIRTRLVAGLQHAADTRMPRVTVWRDLDAFVDRLLPTVTAGALNVVAHPSDTAQECPTGIAQHCNLLIGPEGGFIDEEIEKFKDKRFTELSLGPRIMPVETAVHVLLAKLCF